MTVEVSDFRNFMRTIDSDSVDLILTDPPYAISKDTGFSKGKMATGHKAKYKNYNMDFGIWDKQEIDVVSFCTQAHRILKNGGTLITFYDIWKLSKLSDQIRDAGFAQLRFIEWIKTNPVPVNSKINYLTNCREVAITAVKKGGPTFHSAMDKGIYEYPTIQNKRLHPTQKPIKLFENLIIKHSNAKDVVVDPFVGSGTTAVACKKLNRRFKGCDVNKKYVDIALQRLLDTQLGLF